MVTVAGPFSLVHLFFTLELAPSSSTSPFDLMSAADDQRATVAPELRKAPPPTAPFGELPLRHLFFHGWPTPHLAPSTPVL
jgi:hypothetical protein